MTNRGLASVSTSAYGVQDAIHIPVKLQNFYRRLVPQLTDIGVAAVVVQQQVLRPGQVNDAADAPDGRTAPNDAAREPWMLLGVRASLGDVHRAVLVQ